MTDLPDNERDLLLRIGVAGKRILEFGNKRNPTGCYRDWYLASGAASYTCVDWNGEDGALPLDVREPLELGQRFDLVTNFGFAEHVEGAEGQRAFFENVHRLCGLGGVMVHLLPLIRNWQRHDGIRFTYTEDFVTALAVDNDYAAEDGLDLSIGRAKMLVVGTLIKAYSAPFRWESAAREVMPC